jgi:arginyl-tRNA synthetase
VFHQIENTVQRAFHEHIAARYGVDLAVAVEQPKQSDFGELAIPAAFQLAKLLKQAPKKIAAELIEEIGPIEGVATMEMAGNGYINLRLDRAAYALDLLRGAENVTLSTEGKIIVEHTNINPNKAAHIGHLRNAVLGDTFVRMLRASGQAVEVQNYIDNTGVQVADVVAGFHFLEKKSEQEVAALIDDPSVRFDYLCWDLYARTSQYYKDVPESLAWRTETLHALEAGEGELARLAVLVADAIVQYHLATMLRLGVEYDVLPRESEILHLHFWSAAFEKLKSSGAIYLETEGKNAGCWVMPASAFSTDSESEDSKVIVRSNGIVTYVGKDIAYQLWKFGLLGKDFFYRPLMTYPDGHVLSVTTAEPQPADASFGRAHRVYNVIDARQSYLQDVVVAGLRALGASEAADHSIHFSYEMVALSPRCCADLGIELSEEDRKRPYVEVSGRKGLGVKADDLIDKLIETMLREVKSRHEDAPAEERERVAKQIAIGALRYFLLKFTRPTVIAFDFQEALSFEGEAGPYVQYAAVRARNIERKLEERGDKLPDFRVALTHGALARQLAGEDFWQVLLAASKSDAVLERAVIAGEPSHVARYAFQLAQSFNNFYHQYPILSEQDREKKTFLLWMTSFFRRQLESTLGVLGIEVPVYM